MGLFYRQLPIDHQPATALHAAKLQWLQNTKQSFQQLPYFWAGMVYSGANEPVDIVVKVAKSYPGKTMVLVLLVLLAVSLIFFIKKITLRK